MNAAPPSDDASIGACVRAARLASGLTLRDLSARLHVSPATMSALENGKAGISVARLQLISAELDLPVAELLRASARTASPSVATSRQTAPALPREHWRAYAPLALPPVLAAALAAIRDRGYAGCTMREIAERANLSVPGLYHHHRSKQEMLVKLFDMTMDDLLRRSRSAREEGSTPTERFCHLAESIALFHANRPELGYLGTSEMRSLLPRNRERIAALRREQQQMIDLEVTAAIADGSFRTTHPHEASRAVVTLCTSLPQWFRIGGPDSAQDVATLYVGFALDLVGGKRH